MSTRHIRFSMEIEVYDVEEFLRAANNCTDARDSHMTFDENDLTGAAIMLLDPGIAPSRMGYEIEGSDAVEIDSAFLNSEGG